MAWVKPLFTFVSSVVRKAPVKDALMLAANELKEEAAAGVGQAAVAHSRTPSKKLPTNPVTERYDAYNTQGSRGFLRALNVATDQEKEQTLPSFDELERLFEQSRGAQVVVPQSFYDTPDIPVLSIPYWDGTERKGQRRFRKLKDGTIEDVTSPVEFGTLGEEHATNQFNNWVDSTLIEPVVDRIRRGAEGRKAVQIAEGNALKERVGKILAPVGRGVKYISEREARERDLDEFLKKQRAAVNRKAHST